jgi:long-subunit fatty acid transport protein
LQFAPTSLQLTTAWNVNAAYEHFWSPAWRTSVYGGYAAVSYNSLATSEICGFGTGAIPATGIGSGCSPNWNTWWIGSRTQWNVTKDFYMGVDVMYFNVKSGNLGQGICGGNNGTATFSCTVVPNGGAINTPANDVNNVSVRFRVHRDFYP